MDEAKITSVLHQHHIENTGGNKSPIPSEKNAVGANHDASHFERTLAGRALGTLVLEVDGKQVLMPTPSSSPQDPLNWSRGPYTLIGFITKANPRVIETYKIYTAVVASLATFMANFLAAAPAVSIVPQAIQFTGLPPDVQKTSYFFSAAACLQGASMFIWIPLAVKYGRRAPYVINVFLLFFCIIWCALSKTYTVMLIARLGVGLFGGGIECLTPMIITDIFFVHERGKFMSFYQSALGAGVSLGSVIAGAIIENHDWPYIYWVAAALVGFVAVVVLLTFKETAFRREDIDLHHIFEIERHNDYSGTRPEAKKTALQNLALFSGTYTNESLSKMFLRPMGLVTLPAVLWATLIFSGTIGFIVAINGNYSVAYATTYGFSFSQAAYCWTAVFLGSLLGIPFGGHLGDYLMKIKTHRNGGVAEPEFRLLAIIPEIVTGPLSLILYGVGFGKALHWMVPTIGLGLLMFTIVSATNIAMVYAIDVYKPVAGEVIVAILGFKAFIGFALGFGTNLWVANQGYIAAFGEMAAIAGGIFLLALAFYFYGASLRKASMTWRITQAIQWNADRDDVAVVAH